jgi:hypothetical protein
MRANSAACSFSKTVASAARSVDSVLNLTASAASPNSKNLSSVMVTASISAMACLISAEPSPQFGARCSAVMRAWISSTRRFSAASRSAFSRSLRVSSALMHSSMGSSISTSAAVMRLASESINWQRRSAGSLIDLRTRSSSVRADLTSMRAARASFMPAAVVTS